MAGGYPLAASAEKPHQEAASAELQIHPWGRSRTAPGTFMQGQSFHSPLRRTKSLAKRDETLERQTRIQVELLESVLVVPHRVLSRRT